MDSKVEVARQRNEPLVSDWFFSLQPDHARVRLLISVNKCETAPRSKDMAVQARKSRLVVVVARRSVHRRDVFLIHERSRTTRRLVVRMQYDVPHDVPRRFQSGDPHEEDPALVSVGGVTTVVHKGVHNPQRRPGVVPSRGLTQLITKLLVEVARQRRRHEIDGLIVVVAVRFVDVLVGRTKRVHAVVVDPNHNDRTRVRRNGSHTHCAATEVRCELPRESVRV
mmetsp:Transcript_33782/g.107943  ORF Transcript_33782/g.107943 Transcript_33782/m.107943 type:complete len:224 (-) Transcript_33782:489-1160(-)